MRSIVLATLLSCAAASVASAKKPELPSNVSVRAADKHNSYIDAVDFSYTAEHPVEFAKVKLCVAESISYESTTLQDSAGAFVGPATGRYYSNTSSTTVPGGNVFKYVDDSLSTLIATGTADGGPTAMGLTRHILKFDLKAGVNDVNVTLRFSGILRAQQNTGIASNDGFQPIGVWSGAKPMQAYQSLEGIANRVKACLK